MNARTRRVSVIGLGYVGLCTAATFASKGFRVIGIDVDDKKIDLISKGSVPVHEPGLDRLISSAAKRRRLWVGTDVSRVVETDVTFLTVGTPSRNDGSIDLAFVMKATEVLGGALREKDSYHLAVVKSTVTPGTTNGIVKRILEKSSGKTVGPKLGLAANPEFLKEGTAIIDALHPDKIIIGTNDRKSATHLTTLYKDFYGTRLPPLIVTNPETAELVKYASNAFLATKVSFINTIANIAQQIPGVDVGQVAEALGHDPRIGPLFLKAGPGYGGSCFHKDLQALIKFGQDNGYDPILMQATEKTNEEQANRIEELSERLVGPLNQKRIAVLGLAFKKDTDDIREAASLRVIDRLLKKGAKVVAYDPIAIPNAKMVLADTIEFADDAYAALKGADCCIVMTEWDEFKKLRPADYRTHMKTPNVVDARRLYRPEEFETINFLATGYGAEVKFKG